MKYFVVLFALLFASCSARQKDQVKLAEDEIEVDYTMEESGEEQVKRERIRLREVGKKYPFLAKYLKGKTPEDLFPSYSVFEKEGYTFVVSVDQEFTDVLLQVAIYQGDTLTGNINTFKRGPFSEESLDDDVTVDEELKPTQPNDSGSIYVMDASGYFQFGDFNEDGHTDFILNYYAGGSAGSYVLVAYQKGDTPGFNVVMNDLSVMYDPATKLLLRSARYGVSGSSTLGFNPKTLQVEFVNEWSRNEDSLFFEVRKGKKTNKHLHLLKENEDEWEVIENIRDSLVSLK